MANTGPANTAERLNGFFKDRFEDQIVDLVPESAKVYKMAEFNNSKKIGGDYVQAVTLSYENGFTYGGSEGLAFDLLRAKPSISRDARVRGTELVLRSVVSTGRISRAQTSEQAFEKELKYTVGNMLKSMHHRLEITTLYGGTAIGTIETTSAIETLGATGSDLDGTQNRIKIFDWDWASRIWLGSNCALIDVYDGTTGNKKGTMSIRRPSIEEREVVVEQELNGLASGDKIYWASARDNEFIGLQAIGETVGTLFNIDNSEFELFQGNVVEVGTDNAAGAAALTFDAVECGIALMVNKGVESEDVDLLVSPDSWNTLLSEQDAKRVHDKSYDPNKAKAGHKSIEFYGQNGIVRVHSHSYIKLGYAYGVVKDDLERIGSTEVTFKIPGLEGEEGRYIERLNDQNGYELRCYSDQALFTARPCAVIVYKFIKPGK